MKKIFAFSVCLCVLVCPAPSFAQTVGAIGTSAVRSGDDFATRSFQDPWDMNERTDLGWWVNGADQPEPGFGQPVSFSGGLFTGVTINTDPSFFLLETGNPNAAKLGKIGLNHPIDANTYRYLAYRMSVTTADNTQFIWNRETIYDTTTTMAFNVGTTPGFRIYLVDLASLSRINVGADGFSWGGLVKSLRMDPTTRSGETIQLDWVRLVNAGSAQTCRTVNWTGPASVDIYVTDTAGTSLGKIASGVSQNSASPGCTATGTGHAYYAGALAPGTYRVGVSAVGGTAPTSTTGVGTTWVVNDLPTLTFTSPDPEGSSDDFATTVLNNPWDMNALTDLDLITNVSAPQIASVALENTAGAALGTLAVFQGTSVSAAASGSIVGDPYVDPLFGGFGSRGFNNRIDTSRYRILTVEYGIPNLARDILHGSIARVVWRVAGQPAESVSDDIIVNHRAGANVLDKFTVDLADRSVLAIEQGQFTGVTSGGWENGSSSNPGVDIFRFDPHEFDNPTDFYIRRIKLAAFEKAATSYTIRWQYTDAQPGTVDLYYSTTNTGACASGIPIASPSASTGQHTWTVSGLGNGTYYVCAVVTDSLGASNETWAKWPLVKDSSFNADLPRLALSRSHLNFGVVARPNQAFPLVGTSAQTVRVSVVGGSATPCWTVDNNLAATYTVTLSNGGSSLCGSGSFTVALNPDNHFNVVGPGSATFTVREVTAGSTMNAPQYVTAFHQILSAGAAPSGLVDTPLQGAVVSGSIAVTGWAIDDVDIASIGIYRDPVGSESGLVFIGNAVRVDDARSDVESANPTTPFNYRAGWGYLLLTNFLPDGGDGSYTLHVIATDVDGHQTTLGSRLIVGANSSAIKPFGAIDTPGQGEVITGSTSYNNFGWVLARGGTKASPFYGTGASVVVVIDGVAVGSPSGWTSRPDLTALFPSATYSGVDRALGVYTFNPGALALGVHTIAWGVTADNGQADGIGSRYFTTASGASLTLGRAVTAPARLDDGPDLGRRASAVGTIATDGPQTVVANEMSRVVVAPFRGRTGEYHAYLVANGNLRTLPVGASFDNARGILYWQPGVGYTGAYDFVVVRDGRERVPVRVVLEAPQQRAPRSRAFDIRFSADATSSASGLR